jgi:hypothetical protein
VDGDSVLVTDGRLSARVSGAGTVVFWYWAGPGGRLAFYADGGAARFTAAPDGGGWRVACVAVEGSGAHVLEWVAANARVDQVVWMPGVIVREPAEAGPGGYGGDTGTGFFPGAADWLAFMSGPSAYLAPPGEAVAAAAGQYDGWLYAGGARPEVRGTLSVKLSKASGTLSVKAVLPGGSVAFPAVKRWGWFARYGCGVTLTARTGETVTLYFNRDRFWGGATGGRLGGGALLADGARNRYADAKDAAAKLELEAGYKGYYTVQLPWSGANPPVEIRPGAGYLTLTVGAKGAVKYAGRLADGAAVSGSAPLCAFRACRGDAAVPVFKELYSKKGSVGGLLWIDPAGPVRTDRRLGWEVAWRRAGAGAGAGAGVSEAAWLESAGGRFAKGQGFGQGALAFYSAAGVRALFPGADFVAAPSDAGVRVAVDGGRLAMDKATPPVKDADGVWDYGAGANPAGATLSYAPATGIFKGAFKVWTEAAGRQKAVSVGYTGVASPVSDAAFADGPVFLGAGLVPVAGQKEKVSVEVWIE